MQEIGCGDAGDVFGGKVVGVMVGVLSNGWGFNIWNGNSNSKKVTSRLIKMMWLFRCNIQKDSSNGPKLKFIWNSNKMQNIEEVDIREDKIESVGCNW